jgi:DNA-binding response OmpR family regulator
MKPLSACTSIVGIADTGLRMVVRELLITLKLRDIEYVSDTEALLQAFQHKPGVDLIILQHDLPPGGGSLDVAKSVRWGKMSPNRNVPIVTIGRDWTPQKLVDVREAGINEVIAMPTAMQTVQRKLASALDPERPFVSVDDYRGPSRRRRATGHQGPFRRAADRIAEQLHSVEDKSARRTEKLEKLAAARPPEERPALTASSPPPSRRPEPALEIPAEAKFLAQSRLNDFDGKSKGARPPQSQPVPSPRSGDLGGGRVPPASLPASKPPAPPSEHDSAPAISVTSEEAEVSPPPIPSAPHGGEGLPNLKDNSSATSDGSEPPPPDETMLSPRPGCSPSDSVGGESKPQRETKAPPSDTKPSALQAPTVPVEPPVAPASEDPTLSQKTEPSPTPIVRPNPDDNSTEPERPAASTDARTASPVALDASHGDGARSLSHAAHQPQGTGNGIGQFATSAQCASSESQLPGETCSPALPPDGAQSPGSPPNVAPLPYPPVTASEPTTPSAPPQSVAEPPAPQASAPTAINTQPVFSASAGSPPGSEQVPPGAPAAINGPPPMTTVGSQAVGGTSNFAGFDPVATEPPTVPMTQADLFKMLTAKKKKP